MFLISDALKRSFPDQSFSIENEQPVETLALCGADLDCRFCTFLDNEKFIDSLSGHVSMVITTPQLAEKLASPGRGTVAVSSPRLLFFALHNALCDDTSYRRPSFATQIAPSASVSPLASVAGENVRIGENVVIEPFVTIYPNVVIGEGSVIRSGARLGGVGFEFKQTSSGVLSVTHAGGVRIGRYVEIQNNTCVNRAVYPWDDTVLGDYVKLDDLIYVAHGVKIGERTMVVALSGIGGRTVIGDKTWVGLGAKVRNGISLGDSARANMGAVVTLPVPDGQAVSGNFAIEHQRFLHNMKESTMEQNIPNTPPIIDLSASVALSRCERRAA